MSKPRPRSAAVAKAAPLAKARRQPQQERGERRVGAILDAAAEVIAEVGVEAATTNAIAERAGAAVGSLYHFFPNKEAIIRALAARYEAELREISRQAMPAAAQQLSTALMAEAIIEPLARFMERNPAYLPVFYATADPRHPSCLSVELHQAIVGLVEQLIATRTPSLPPARRQLKANFSVQMVHRMLEYAWSVPVSMRADIIRELKRVLALHAEMIESGRDPLQE
jgi:AcrR family transcriptional regulator